MVGDRSATGWRLVGDRSPTGRRPVASSRKEVPTRLPTSRRPVGNQSPISRRPVADRSATSPRSVADQSPTSRRLTAKPSCDSSATSATSAIVLNFGRGEVAERLQCMSDRGLMGRRRAFTIKICTHWNTWVLHRWIIGPYRPTIGRQPDVIFGVRRPSADGRTTGHRQKKIIFTCISHNFVAILYWKEF